MTRGIPFDGAPFVARSKKSHVRLYQKVVLDIKTGRTKLSKPFMYDGPIGALMPNAHPASVKSPGQLSSQLAPVTSDGSAAVERIPWSYYHGQTYTSGTTTQLIFFQTTGAITTTNMQAAGQIPAPMYFDLYHIGIYFQIGVTTTALSTTLLATGGLNDVALLSNGVATFSLAQKTYWQSFIWQLPPGFGATGVMTASATYSATAGDSLQQGTLGVPDVRSRQSFWGDITLPHNQNFSLQLDWASAVTLKNGNSTIIPYLEGYLYRRAL